MARHETEMHRQRREMLEALNFAAAGFATIASNGSSSPAVKELALSNFHQCKAAIKSCQPACDIGLFDSRDQMDLQDRRDLVPYSPDWFPSKR